MFSDIKYSGIGIETTSFCNAKCEFCVLGHKEQEVTNLFTGETWVKEKKFMNWQILENIIETYKPDNFVFSGQTEPLIDHRLSDIIDLIVYNNKDVKIAMFTNANLLNEEIAEMLIKNKNFGIINFSLNAITDETRMKVMGISYQIAEENIVNFLKKRREYNRENNEDLAVGVSFITTELSRHEIPIYKSKWKRILNEYHCNNEVGIFLSGNWGGEIISDKLTYKPRNEVMGCGQFDCTNLAFDVDGNIVLCCYNYSKVFGSGLEEDNLRNWYNRKKVLNMNESKLYAIPHCNTCVHKYAPMEGVYE